MPGVPATPDASSVPRHHRNSSVVVVALAEADRTELPCYLETTEESNTRFYERHGFTTTVHRAGADLPEFWTMTRAPR